MPRKAEDIIMKNVFDLLKGDALKFFGIDKKIVAPARTELNFVELKTNINDNVYLLEDDTFIHLEFQTTNKRDDIRRFMASDAVLFYKEDKPIKTIVVYSADIDHALINLDGGSIKYELEAFYMIALDGDILYNEVKKKVDHHEPLSKQDLMSIVLLPIMKSKSDKLTRIRKSIELSKQIDDTDAKLQTQAMLYLFAEKFVNDSAQLGKLKELLNMTAIAEMMLKDERVEIAKNALKEGASIEFTRRITGLDESTIKHLQAELDNE